MTKTLETADHILKLVLSTGVILCYLFRVIEGPIATILFILACTVIIFSVTQLIIVKFIRD